MNCTVGTSCGASCISQNKDCISELGEKATKTINKISGLIGNFLQKHKGAIANEAPVIAAGFVAGSMAGPVVGSLASAATRTAITIGKRAYSRATADKVKEALANGQSLMSVAKEVGTEFISDLKNPKFQRQLEKKFLSDLAYGAVASPIGAISKVPGLGDVVAIKTGTALNKVINSSLQKIKKRIKANG